MFGKRIALGVATAALAVTSLVSPFTPAADAQVMFKPDLRVNYDTQFHYDDYYSYHFHVKNIGAASVENVGLVARCYYLNTNGSVRHTVHFLGGANFPQDKQIQKIVKCPKQSAQSLGARLQAVVVDDLNPADNAATSPSPWPHLRLE